MTTWMLCTLVFSALISASARLVEVAIPPVQPRRHVWVVCILVSVLVPGLALLTGGRLPLWSVVPHVAIELPAALTSWTGDVGTAVPIVESSAPTLSAVWLLAGLWLVLSGVLLCGYVAIWLRFLGSASEWRVGQLFGHRVRVAARVGPAVFGFRRPVIVVPEWVLDADPAVQRLVVLHELEHTRARDHILLALAPLVLVAMPWNLTLWWQVHRLRLAVELDCDRRVMSRGVPARDYGSMLIDIAGRSDSLPSALAALGGPRTSLETRIIAMSTRTPSHWRSRAAILTAAAGLLLVTALETFALMAPAATVRFDATTAASSPLAGSSPIARAGSITPMPADTPLVVIDGVIVRDRDIERVIGGAVIASIEMVRGADAVRRFGADATGGVLLITTARPEAIRTRTDVAPARVTSADAATVAAAASRAERVALRIQADAVSVEGAAVANARPVRDGVVTLEGVTIRPTDAATRAAGTAVAARQLRVQGVVGGPAPLYVVDGVLATTAVDIDPDTIESIEVLKGPAAERIYGERAAAGVIRITTKK